MTTHPHGRQSIPTVKQRLPVGFWLVAQACGALLGIAALSVWALMGGGLAILGLAAGASLLCAVLIAVWCRKIVRYRATIWIGSYLRSRRVPVEKSTPLDVCFLFRDHFEQEHGRVDAQQQLNRVRCWQDAYAQAVKNHEDSDGRCPQHTWFFPVALSDPVVRPVIMRWPAMGWGEIEYHLHHRAHYSDEEIRKQIITDIGDMQAMGAIPSGRYGFVHGMFALAGGHPRYCKAVHELDVLMETGCYADFTFPALWTPAQPQQVNSIYYAHSTGQPKPYDTGIPVAVGDEPSGLMIFQGPLWTGWSRQLFDDAHVAASVPPYPRRINRWLQAHVHVAGRPNWVFIAVYSHSATETNREMLFSGPMQRLWRSLEKRFKIDRARLHYVTAREAFNIVKAAEAGCDGNPNDFRDFLIPSPHCTSSGQRAEQLAGRVSDH